MKTILNLISAALLVAVFTSCSKELIDDVQTEKKAVTFTCSVNEGESLELLGSRAITANGTALTDLAVFDYVGDELKNTYTQKSTDADFGTPTLQLEYGEHKLVFVLSRGADFSIDGSTCKWSKASDTFTKVVTLNVTRTTGSQTTALDRVVTRLALYIVDEIPASVAKIRMTPSRFYNEYSIPTMQGVNPSTNYREADLTSARGKSNYPVTWFTLSPSDDVWNIDATFTFLDENDNVIVTHSKSNIPLKTNRSTVIKGRCFDTSTNVPFTITVNDIWDNDYIMDLY